MMGHGGRHGQGDEADHVAHHVGRHGVGHSEGIGEAWEHREHEFGDGPVTVQHQR